MKSLGKALKLTGTMPDTIHYVLHIQSTYIVMFRLCPTNYKSIEPSAEVSPKNFTHGDSSP